MKVASEGFTFLLLIFVGAHLQNIEGDRYET